MNLQVNTQIYSLQAITLSLEDFKDIATITVVSKDTKYAYLYIKNIKEEYKKDFCDEYMNYLLEASLQLQ